LCCFITGGLDYGY